MSETSPINTPQAFDENKFDTLRAISTPLWYRIDQNQSIMKTLAKGTLLGIAGLSAAAFMSKTLNGQRIEKQTLGIGSAILLPSILTSLYFANKKYWKDPKYHKQLSEQVKNLSFEEIIRKFPIGKTFSYTFISQADLMVKFDEWVDEVGPNYHEIINRFRHIFHIFSFYPFYTIQRVLEEELNDINDYDTFKQIYGLQPISDRLLVGSNALEQIKQLFLKKISEHSWSTIKENYKEELPGQSTSILSEEELSDFFTNNITNTPLIQNIQQHGQCGFVDLVHKYIDVKLLKEKALEEIGPLLPSQVIHDECYGWALFDSGILEISDYKTECINELIENNLQWYDIVERFGPEAFERGLLSGEDAHIQQCFLQSIDHLSFEEFMDAYKGSYKDFCLLSKDHTTKLEKLLLKKDQLIDQHKKNLQNIQDTVNRTIINQRKVIHQATNEAYTRKMMIHSRLCRLESNLSTANSVEELLKGVNIDNPIPSEKETHSIWQKLGGWWNNQSVKQIQKIYDLCKQVLDKELDEAIKYHKETLKSAQEKSSRTEHILHQLEKENFSVENKIFENELNKIEEEFSNLFK